VLLVNNYICIKVISYYLYYNEQITQQDGNLRHEWVIYGNGVTIGVVLIHFRRNRDPMGAS